MKKGRKVKIAGLVVLVLVALAIVIYFVSDTIYYLGLNKKVYVELGEKLPEAEMFLKDSGDIEYITDISGIDATKEGNYQIKVNYNGKEKKVYIVIEDTVAPEVKVKDVNISIYDEVTMKDLIEEINDKSKVKTEWKDKPRFGVVGSYKTTIVVTDEAGNKTEVTSMVNICRVKSYVEYRYGEDYPTVEDFIFDDRDSGKMVTDISQTISKPGTYYVTIEIDEKNYKSKLIVIDENPPIVVGKDAEVTINNAKKGNIPISPKDFVATYIDEDDVTMYFVDKPAYDNKSEIPVKIAVADTSGNTTIIDRTLYVVENLGIDVQLKAEFDNDVLTGKLNCTEATLVSGTVNTNKIGRYPIVVNVDGDEKSIYVSVVDMDIPKATAVEVVLEKKQNITASMFVKDIIDSTKVTLEFVSEPDKINRGVQNVRIKLTDEGGNISYVDSKLTILYDAVDPAIFGVTNVTTYIRQVPDYLLGVSAIDDVDGDIDVIVDDSKVNYEAIGKYKVTYKATDLSGNVVTQVVDVEVKAIDRELVNSMVDDILEEITNESMTLTEKAWASFEYIQENVRYINQADQSSVEKAAYDGLTLGTGDCYTFASLIEVFIERLGGETMLVKRYDSSINHYWQLCNLGTGWYHMDATPRSASSFKCFMKTDAEVLAESKSYWKYDASLYPNVATEAYK